MTTLTETLQPMETMQVKLTTKSSTTLMPQPPMGAKPRTKLRLDPQRALEPARKKLSTLESQRIMAVLVDSIKKTELVTALPNIIENLDRFSVALGAELTHMLEHHKIILESFNSLKADAERMLRKEHAQRQGSQNGDDEDEQGEGSERGSRSSSQQSGGGSRPESVMSNSRAEEAMRNLSLVAKQMQASCKNILRAFFANPSAITAVLKGEEERGEDATTFIDEMNELKDILMGMLLTTPVEEAERDQYLREISQRERYNAGIIAKLEGELGAAVDDKDNDIKKKNDVIRRLQADLHQIEKFSEEHIRRTKSEAEKQEAADLKNSEGKRGKLQQEDQQLKVQLQNLITEHRDGEQGLRRQKFKVETVVENWIQKYDADMGERQDEYEEIDTVYTEEKKQLNELEERFKTLETEYLQIQEERRIARERREAAERELQMCVKAATTIQAFWRSFKVRKALKSKKKKKGGKKKGKK